MTQTQPTLMLASTSRYRRALLERLGLDFEVESPGCDEEVGELTEPAAIVRELSLRKARAVSERHPDALVIGSDQVLALDGQILGKPGTPARARAQLARLSGRAHRLVTGVALIHGASGRERVDHEDFRLVFRTLTAAEIARYVELDDPVDCAGSYKLESRGIWLVDKLDGCDESSIIGLPLIKLVNMLGTFGVRGI
jgi:septum formation protein